MEFKKKHIKATAAAAAVAVTENIIGVPLQRQNPDTSTELN